MDDRIFTVILDWLAFTVPQASVDEIGELLGGEWFEATTGFRGYPTCWLTNQGRQGMGKLGTGAPRNAREVHVDLSAGIVSTWEESKIRSVLHWVFKRGGHITRMDVALDDRTGQVSIAQIKQAVDTGQAVTRSQKFQVLAGSSLRDGSGRNGHAAGRRFGPSTRGPRLFYKNDPHCPRLFRRRNTRYAQVRPRANGRSVPVARRHAGRT